MSYYVSIFDSPTLIVCHPRGGLPCPEQGIKVLSSLPIISRRAKSLVSRRSASSGTHFLTPSLLAPLLTEARSKTRSQNPRHSAYGGRTMSGAGNVGPFEIFESGKPRYIAWAEYLQFLAKQAKRSTPTKTKVDKETSSPSSSDD